MQKLFLIFLFISLSTILYAFFQFNSLPPEIPLWYGRPIGENQIAQKDFIFLPSAISIFYIIVCLLFIKKVKDKFLIKILIGTAFLSTILTTITTVKIINLII